jgi:hypothetical protein
MWDVMGNTARGETSRAKLERLAIEIGMFAANERKQWEKVTQRENREFPPPPTLSFELVHWFLVATHNFLSGKEKDFGKALGLKRGRGRPQVAKPSSKNYDRAKQVFWLRLQDPKENSWTRLSERFKADPRDLQHEQARYRRDIIDEFARELISDTKNDGPPRRPEPGKAQ